MYYILPNPRAKCFHLCQIPEIVFIVIIVAVVVVSVDIFSIAALNALTLDLFPQKISIYPPRPVPHGFNLDLDLIPVPSLCLWSHYRSVCL